MSPTLIAIRKLSHGEDLPLPAYASAHAAGLDLLAALPAPVDLAPGQRLNVPTGIAIALPEGFEAQIRARSGLAARHGIGLVNAPGTIDADYRGEIGVILINWGEEIFRIERGMRIAQLVIARYERIIWSEQDELPASDRAEGGFGSTGTSTPDARLPDQGTG